MMTVEQVTTQKLILSEAHYDFQKGLNAYAFYKVHNRETGEDLVQSTFVKTWNYLIKGGKVETMKAFLYHILNNLIVDEYRKHKETSLDVLLEKGFEPSVNNAERLFNIIDGKVALWLVPELPSIYKKVVHMRYVQDWSLAEIALATGQSRNTVAVQTHRGIAKLKLLYNPA